MARPSSERPHDVRRLPEASVPRSNTSAPSGAAPAAAGERYGDIAVGFHWLIALLIVGLLAIGKYMSGLAPDDPMRFALTQWHKSFGIAVLILSVLRLAWRFTHRPPPEPASVPPWQKKAAHLAHVGLYALLFAVPITGWIMVSASPLDVDTLLFDVIPWPHLPPFPELANREAIAESFEGYHELAGNLMILLLLAHVGAALKHHFVDKDTVLVRMLPDWSRSWNAKLAAFGVAVAAAGTGLYLYADAGGRAALLAAGESEVSFVAGITGDETPGFFPVSEVDATLDEGNPEASRIEARVETGGVTSDNSQMAASLPNGDWFDSENHPEATFASSAIRRVDETTLEVDGTLTIKGNALDVTFPMTLADEEGKRVARGEFTVDRREFELGLDSQATDDYVDYPVLIRFRFDIAAPTG